MLGKSPNGFIGCEAAWTGDDVYFSLVINLSCTTLLKQLNVCSVCSDSHEMAALN